MRQALRLCIIIAILFCFAGALNASTITFTLTNLGSNNFRYDYTVVSFAPVATGTNILLDIFFPKVTDPDRNNDSFTSAATPTGWTADWIPPSSPNLSGFIEFGGITGAVPLSGLSVDFHHTGTVPLDRQAYVIINAEDFEFLVGDPEDPAETPFTTPAQTPPGAVPEPSSLILLATGVVGLLALGLKRH